MADRTLDINEYIGLSHDENWKFVRDLIVGYTFQLPKEFDVIGIKQ